MRAKGGMEMRTTWVRASGLVALLVLSACTTTSQLAGADFKPPEGSYRLVVIQPDIRVGALTAGGAVEQREDWTNQAREHVLKALQNQQAKRGGETKIAATHQEAGWEAASVADLVWLHNAVGNSIKLHKYAYLPLPTKKNQFDWTLGSKAVEFGRATNYDYALFLHAQDTFSTGGRVALQALGLLGCGFGVCVMPTGGQQIAFASLVDLKTGNVVWFNFLASSVGDIRTPEGAEKMVNTLLDKMKAGKESTKTT
jgi:hypothetical protein